MQDVINAGGSVLINCPTHTILATKIEQLPDDSEILECFPLTPRPAFDPDDLNANAIGILGYFFSGTPSNGDSIVFNSTTSVWEFEPAGISGTVGVASGGTGLASVPANSILYAGALNTFTATSLGSTFSVTSNILNVVNDSSTQKVEIANNNNLVGTRKRINFLNGSNTTVDVTDDPTNNKIDVTVSASSSAGTQWDQLSSPSGNLSLSMGSSNTIFSWGNATAGNSLLQLKDSNNNSGNGVILDLVSGSASTINLFRATVSGTSNGVVIDNTGKLSAIGTGVVEASTLKGASGTGLAVKTSSGFVYRNVITSNADLTITNSDGVGGDIGIDLGTSVVTGVANDTNVTGSIGSNIITLGWLGQLAKSRQNSNTVYTDQSNTYVAGNKQNFVPNSTNAALNIGTVSGNPSALTNGDMWQDAMTGKVRMFENGVTYDVLQYICNNKSFSSNNVATNLFEIDLQPGTGTSIILEYAVHAYDGTNGQIRRGTLSFSAVNKSGTVVQEEFTSSGGVAPSIGTLTANFSIVGGTNKITVNVTPNTSLTANTFYIKYYIKNLSEQTITVL